MFPPGPTLGKTQHLLRAWRDGPSKQQDSPFHGPSFASGKGREAQSRCQFALGQTPGAWPAERTLPEPQRSNLAQLLAGRGGGGCMQLPVSMCRTCTRHRLTQPELACARKSRNQPSRQAWFSEVRGHGRSQATPLLCHDSAQGAQICHLE